MKTRTITFKLLFPVICAFVVMNVTVLFIANERLIGIIDESQHDVYTEKLEAIRGTLQRKADRLKATGLVKAYEADFKASALEVLGKSYYSTPFKPVYPFIIDRKGRIVMHPGIAYGDDSFAGEEYTDRILELASGDFNGTLGNGERTYFVFRNFEEWDWTIVYAVPFPLKYADALEFRNVLFVIMGGMASLALVVLSIVIARLTKPIKVLTQVSSEIASGDLSRQITVSSRDEIGTLARSFSLMRDSIRNKISQLEEENAERRRAEEAGRESKDFLQTVIDGFPEALMVINRDYTIALANRTVREIAGETDPVAARLTCHTVSHGSETPCEEPHVCPLREVFATGKPLIVEHSHRNSGGKDMQVEVIAAPIFNDKGEVVRVIESCRDITARLQAEDERRRMEDQVRHVQKLESLGVLAGGIAHDFNNILMGVLGNAGLALIRLTPESPVWENVKDIETAAVRAADLARQMLAYSGKGQFVIEAISLNTLVREMTHLLKTVISKKALLKFNLADNLPLVEADPTQVRQVAMNLITNASEAIGDRSGIITVNTGVVEVDAAYLAGTYLGENLNEGYYSYLEVSDTGRGMDEETLEKIFDPFFTTKFTGRGLGLAAVLGIVRGHEGSIKVYSEVGHGSSFKVLFPSAKLAAESPRKSEMDLAEAISEWRGQGTILVVDDEETVRSVAKMTLETFGFAVLTAADGREGVKVFSEHADEISAVVLDMTMPHMGGDEAYQEMRRIQSDVTVILSSGYSEKESTNRFTGKGLAGFIQKPYKPTELVEKLREVLMRNP